ncbi:MAG: hypothetical protein V4608_09960 [Bacteroidota bacterium]
MANNKFEIKILKDVGNKNIHLESMSIGAAKSLKIFIESLIKIAELQDNASDIKISLSRGSAIVALEGPAKKIETIEKQFRDVADNKSGNKTLVSSWRNIQQTISANGLIYEAIFSRNGQKESVLNFFKDTKQFQVKRKKRKFPEYSLKFYTGRLFDAGGQKHSNIHIELKEDLNYTIACSEIDVKEIIKYIYSSVTVAVWENKKIVEGKEIYKLCDFYSSPEEVQEFKLINERIFKLEGTEKQKEVYSIIESYIHERKYREVKKFIKLFNHKSIEPDILRMILVATKSVKDESEIADVRSEIKKKCIEAMGEIF